jgi:copper chaperone CopZ
MLILSFLVGGGLGCQSTPSPSRSDSIALGSAGSSDVQTDGSAPDAQRNTAILWVHGMACPQCANNVDLQLLKVPGVEGVKVDMGSGMVFATLSESNPPSQEQLSRAIERTGFTLKRIQMP